MTVYIDLVFLLNGTVNYLLLLAAGRLSGDELRRGRLALGAALGGCYAVALFLPGLGFLAHPLCKAGTAALMLLLGYGHSHRLLRVSLVFLAVSAAFGGGILAITLLGGRGLTLRNGVFCSSLDLRLILLSAALCYTLITLALSRTAQHAPAQLRAVTVTLGDRRVELTALVDTGHTLTDPVTGRRVLVAEGTRVAGLFPAGEAPGAEELFHPAEALSARAGSAVGKRLRLLPYRAVGVSSALLLAVRSDGVTVGEEDLGDILVALSPTPVSDGGGYSALIGA